MRRSGVEGIGVKAIAGVVVMAVAAGLLAGCEVNTHKSGNGEDVKVATPFGGLRVKTDTAEVLKSIELAAYPGAERVQKEGKDNGSADVSMSFGDFQLRVKAVSFRTGDSPQKVEAFYRGELKRFGDVIACRDDRPVGTPVRTAEGLTCDSLTDKHITVNNHPSKGELELKTGSKMHQHMVAIDEEGGGTKFGLVVLDLPDRFFSNSGDDGDDRNKQ